MRRLFVPTARLKASNYGRGLQKQVGLLGGLDSDDPGQANGLQRLAQALLFRRPEMQGTATERRRPGWLILKQRTRGYL